MEYKWLVHGLGMHEIEYVGRHEMDMKVLKVRTFSGTDREAVDKQINEWLAHANVKVQKTSIAFKALREKGSDAVTGRTTTRRAVAVAISVWYEEPGKKPASSKPTTWVFGQPD